jgi:multimeric flavodoxin WrbA
MRVLALIGSPRKKGNSDLLADEVLKGAKASGAIIEKIYLDDYLVSHFNISFNNYCPIANN